MSDYVEYMHRIRASIMAAVPFSVDYTLYPPPIDHPVASSSKLPPKSAHTSIPILPSDPSPKSETSTYYSALSTTLKQAQKELNENLTAWKDLIGDREKSKEDPGTIGYGRGKAAVMSEDVRGELRNQSQNDGGADSDSSDEA